MTSTIGNKFLVYVLDNGPILSTILGSHENVQVARVPSTLFNTTQTVIECMKNSLEIRKKFDWDFVVKIESPTILDIDSLVRLNIDERMDIIGQTNRDGSMVGTSWIIGPRVVDVYSRLTIPRDYRNSVLPTSQQLTESLSYEDLQKIPEERVYFWTQILNIPFTRVGLPSQIINFSSDTYPMRLKKIYEKRNSLTLVENPIEGTLESMEKMKKISKGEGRIHISIYCPQGETQFLKNLTDGISRYFLPTMERDLTIYTNISRESDIDSINSILDSSKDLKVRVIGGHSFSHSIWWNEREFLQKNPCDWIVHLSHRTVFTNTVNPIDVLPTPLTGGFSSPGIFLSNGRLSTQSDLRRILNIVDTLSTENPYSVSPSFFTDCVSEKGESEFIEWTIDSIKDSLLSSEKIPSLLRIVNDYYVSREGMKDVLDPRVYGMEVFTNQTNVQGTKFVFNRTTPESKESIPSDHLVVFVGSKDCTVSEMILEYSLFKSLKSRIPNVSMIPGPGFISEVVSDEFYRDVCPYPDLSSYRKTNPVDCGSEKGRRFIENCRNVDDVTNVIGMFIRNETKTGTLGLLDTLMGLVNVRVSFQDSPSTKNSDLVIVVKDHGNGFENQGNGIFTIDMEDESPVVQLNYLNYLTKVKRIEESDSPSSKVIQSMKKVKGIL